MNDLQTLFELRHGKEGKALYFLFSKIKRDYKTFEIPGEDELEEWLEACKGKSQTELSEMFKAYKATAPYNIPPQAKDFIRKSLQVSESDLRVKYSCPEEEMIKTLRESGVKVPYGEGRDMLVRMIADFKMVYPRETLQLQTCSDLVKAMRLNGWWSRDKFMAYVPAAFFPEDREKNLEAA